MKTTSKIGIFVTLILLHLYIKVWETFALQLVTAAWVFILVQVGCLIHLKEFLSG